MHALSTQVVCLLIAQFGNDGGFPVDQPVRQPAVQSAAQSEPAAPSFRQPGASPERAGQVNPASGSGDAPTVPLHSRASLDRAEALIEQFVGWGPDNFEGQPVTLLQCVERAAGTGQQSATVTAYWQLCAAIGRYAQTEDELVVLAGIAPQSEFEQTQIRAEQRSVDARRAQARVDLLAAQEKLAELAQLSPETLPLPADRPFVGKYETRLATMYPNRAIPRPLRTIDRALPHQLTLIEKRAEAVDANMRLRNDFAELYLQGQAPLAAVLGSCRDLRREQDAFLRAVVTYNHQIANYSQSVVGRRVPARSLVATLIRQPTAAAPAMFRDGNVQPAAARQPTLNSDHDPRRGAGEPVGNVRPAFQPDPSRRRFQQQAPAANPSASVGPQGSPTENARAFDATDSFGARNSIRPGSTPSSPAAPAPSGAFDPTPRGNGGFNPPPGSGPPAGSGVSPADSGGSFDPTPVPTADAGGSFDPNGSFQIGDSP